MTTSFNKAKHEYLIDGKPATGVTTVISVLAKPQLISWSARVAVEYVKETGQVFDNAQAEIRGVPFEKVLITTEAKLEEARIAHTKKKEAAGIFGTNAHTLVEELIRNQMNNRMSDSDYSSIQPFIGWAQRNVDRFLFVERQMYDKDLFLAGTADFAYIGKDGKRYVADFKTSSGIFGIDYFLQVAAYKMLAEGEGDAPYDGMTIVRLGKDGVFEVQQLFDYETYKNAFLACLTLYRAQAALRGTVVK